MTRTRAALLVAAVVATFAGAVLVTGHAANLDVTADKITLGSDTVPTSTTVDPGEPGTCASPCPLDAAADAFVSNQSSNDRASNFGADTTLLTNPNLTQQQVPANQYRESFIRFDLNSIPEGAQITATTLTLHREGGAANREYRVQRVAPETGRTPWIEDEVTWDNRPQAVTGVATDVAGPSGSGAGMVSWTGAGLVGDVETFLGDPDANFGWRLTDTGSGNSTSTFTSREGTEANRPKLVITYTVAEN